MLFERPTNASQGKNGKEIFDGTGEDGDKTTGGNGTTAVGASCRNQVLARGRANLLRGSTLDENGGIQIHGSRLDRSGDYRNGESEDSENGLELHLG